MEDAAWRQNLPQHVAAISLGSNAPPHESRLPHVEEALRQLDAQVGRVISVSGLYETITAYVDRPHIPLKFATVCRALRAAESGRAAALPECADVSEVPCHLNAVALINCSAEELTPFELLHRLHVIERSLGRRRQLKAEFAENGSVINDSSSGATSGNPKTEGEIASQASPGAARQDSSHPDGNSSKCVVLGEKECTASDASGPPASPAGASTVDSPAGICSNSEAAVPESTKESTDPSARGAAASTEPYNPHNRPEKFEPVRAIDLDILLYGSRTVDTPRLTIPHRGLRDRNFVLYPLLDCLPASGDLRLACRPAVGLSLRQQLHANLVASGGSFLDALRGVPFSVFPAGKRLLPYGPGCAPHCMGILNLSPESVLGRPPADPVARALSLIDGGLIAVLDVGGQSTARGRPQVPLETELERVVPVIKAVAAARPGFPISVDTTRAAVAAAAVEAGATIVNDISGGRFDPEMLPLIARDTRLSVILGCLAHDRFDAMHSLEPAKPAQGTDEPTEAQVQQVMAQMHAAMERAGGAKIPRWRIMLDPNFGFGKTAATNRQLIQLLTSSRLAEVAAGVPLAVSFSRKHFLKGVAEEALRVRGQRESTVTLNDRDAVANTAAAVLSMRQCRARAPRQVPAVALVRTHDPRRCALLMTALPDLDPLGLVFSEGLGA